MLIIKDRAQEVSELSDIPLTNSYTRTNCHTSEPGKVGAEKFLCRSRRCSTFCNRQHNSKGGSYQCFVDGQAGVKPVGCRRFEKIFSAKGQLPTTSPPSGGDLEILTIKEYVRQNSGLSEHTLANLHFRTDCPHQNRTRQARKNSRAEVGAVELFEIDSVTAKT